MEKLFGRAANKKIFCDVNYTFFQLGGLFLCQYFFTNHYFGTPVRLGIILLTYNLNGFFNKCMWLYLIYKIFTYKL